MKDDFGWDFFMGSQDDCVFTPDGDIEVIEGPALVAQDVRTAALASRGSLFYARDFGQGLIDMLRSPGGNPAAVIQKLREAALGDERVDWDTVQVGQYAIENGQGKYYLKLAVLGDMAKSTLLFDIADLLGSK